MSEKPREGAAETNAAQTPGAAAGQTQEQAPAPYAQAGEAFTAWFNDKVRQLSSPIVMLGTKRARVVSLLADGRLQVEVETEALEPERQFVAFEASYLDQLVRKIAAIGL
ncbi:MAG TPA: hypothetical protein VE713_16300 [Pyrinomonadaceae bacterium]|nr:hypothetical protein [Pyrinomonadaceae bacterium]